MKLKCAVQQLDYLTKQTYHMRCVRVSGVWVCMDAVCLCSCACPQERPIAKDFKAAYQAMHGNKEVQLSRTQGELLYHLEGFFPRGAH